MKLPLLPASLNRLRCSAKLTLTTDGAVSGDVTELFWRAELRAQLLSVSGADREKVLESFLSHTAGFVRFKERACRGWTASQTT